SAAADPVRSRRLAVVLAVADALRLAWCTGGGNPASIALDVHLEDRRVVNQAVDSCECHGGVREDARPLTKWTISRHDQAAPLVTSGRSTRTKPRFQPDLCAHSRGPRG